LQKVVFLKYICNFAVYIFNNPTILILALIYAYSEFTGAKTGKWMNLIRVLGKKDGEKKEW